MSELKFVDLDDTTDKPSRKYFNKNGRTGMERPPSRVGLSIEVNEENLSFSFNGMHICNCSQEAFNYQYSQFSAGLRADLLPNAIRFITTTKDGFVLVIEQKPRYQQVNFTPNYQDKLTPDGAAAASFYLAMPWMVYIVTVNSDFSIKEVRGFVRNSPLTDDDQNLFQIPMHNWYNDNKLCRPFFSDDHQKKTSGSLMAIANELHSEIWDSGFNLDLIENVQSLLKTSSKTTKFEGTLLEGMAAKTYENIVAAKGYNKFYNHWASLSVDKVVQAQYVRVGTLRDYLGSNVENVDAELNFNSLKSRILLAAQNASMMQ